MGLDPGTLGSCPEPKADTQPLSHPGILRSFLILMQRRLSIIYLMGHAIGVYLYVRFYL